MQHAIGSDENEITLYDERGEHSLGRGPKIELARKLRRRIVARHAAAAAK